MKILLFMNRKRSAGHEAVCTDIVKSYPYIFADSPCMVAETKDTKSAMAERKKRRKDRLLSKAVNESEMNVDKKGPIQHLVILHPRLLQRLHHRRLLLWFRTKRVTHQRGRHLRHTGAKLACPYNDPKCRNHTADPGCSDSERDGSADGSDTVEDVEACEGNGEGFLCAVAFGGRAD
jgi:hypothetical protein